jgi:RimJ/RimL family protein N-acetyltransferase
MIELDVPKIETERLLLREIRPADLDEWTRLIFADPDVRPTCLSGT